MAKQEITLEALLAEMARIERSPQSGLSAQEIAERSGRSLNWVRHKLAAARKAGRLLVGRKPATMIDGRPCLVPCYSLKRKRKAESGKRKARIPQPSKSR